MSRSDEARIAEAVAALTARPSCRFPDCTRQHEAKGLCHAHYEQQRRGFKLTPIRPYVVRAQPGTPIADRLRLWIEVDDQDCWLWQGARVGGYGRIGVGPRSRYAHRVAYQALVGPVPEGMELDHLCRNRACVNPDHLEPVTPGENKRRGVGPTALNMHKTSCDHGHPFTAENTYVTPTGKRQCRPCRRVIAARYRSRKNRGAVA